MANLITLEEYKTAKGITSANEDAKITPLLASVTQLVRTYCGRSFTDYFSADKTELFSIFWGESFIQLAETPIVSITSVSERDNLAGSYVPLTSYYVDKDSDSIYKVADNGVSTTSFKEGNGSVQVVYKAGWESAPADLKLAVIDLVSYYLKEEYKPNRSIGSTSMQNAAQDSSYKGAQLPSHIKRVLDLYRVI